MSTYIRGPICGVSNCPSRLWRIIDGRRTCQYGHVMEGDVEFNDEDEDAGNAGVVTRRLNLTTNATGNFQSSFGSSQLQNSQLQQGSKKVYGNEARLLFLKALQFTIKRQCVWLINVQKFPKEFDRLVKILWMNVLKFLDQSDEMGEEDTLASSEDPIIHPGLTQNKKNKKRQHLSLVSTLAILYMAAVHMGVPLYTCDLVKWALTGKLLYFKASEKLPESWKAQLPNYYLGVLEGGKGPHEGQIFIQIANLCGKINFSTLFNNKIMYESMLVKLLMMATLPPEFFSFTLELINATLKETDFELNSSEKPQCWVELKIISYFLVAVQWLLIYDNEKYPFTWISLLSQRQEGAELSQDTVDRQIQKFASSTAGQDTFDWTDEKTALYLEWVENAFLPMQTNEEKLKIDQRIAKRKLYKLFPLGSETYTTTMQGGRHSTFIEELQERYVFLQSNYESSDNSEYSEDDRLLAINTFVTRLQDEIAIEYAVSTEQLKIALKHISQRCLMQLKA